MRQLGEHQYIDAGGLVKNKINREMYNKFLAEQTQMIKMVMSGENHTPAPVDLDLWKMKFREQIGINFDERILTQKVSTAFGAKDNYTNWLVCGTNTADSLCASLLMVTEWIKERKVNALQVVSTPLEQGYKYIDETIYAGEPWRKRIFNDDVRVIILHSVSDKVLETANYKNHNKLINELSTFVSGRDDRHIIISASCTLPEKTENDKADENALKAYKQKCLKAITNKSTIIKNKVNTSGLFQDANMIVTTPLTVKATSGKTQ